VDYKRATIDEVVNVLNLDTYIRQISVKETDSPWNERLLIKRKKHQIDVTLSLWNEKHTLYGRIYRQFLYLYDALEPSFMYKPEIAPDKEKEPKKKKRHDQIWSIYVDSRLERRGIENFYNKRLRKNLFIDSECGFSWNLASMIFDKLWEKQRYNYYEIIDYTNNLEKCFDVQSLNENYAPELEFYRIFSESNLNSKLEDLSSPSLKQKIKEISNLAKYLWKDIRIETTYYGLLFLYQKHVILELIPAHEGMLYLTLYNGHEATYKTHMINEQTEIKQIEQGLKDAHGNIFTNAGF